MNVLRGTALLAFVSSAATAGAQANACKIDEGKPFQLASARIYLQRGSTGKPDEKPKHLANAVKVLTENADRIGNPVGRNWLLGRTLIEWMNLRGALNFTAPRGELGFTTDQQGTVNILAAIDTAFSAVESQAPACADTTLRFRRFVWGKVINASMAALQNNQVDSAEYYANQSMLVYRKTPHAPNILAQIAMRKNDVPAQLRYYQQTVEMSGTDTANTKIRRQAMFNIAVLKQGQAEAATGEQQKAYYTEAADLFRAYLKEEPGNAAAQQGLARTLAAMGDTASVANIYADMIANPSRFTDAQLFEAGSAAAIAKRNADAAKLLESGLAQNPYHRDALYNLANVYFAMEDVDRMAPVVRRLIEVDPSNPDNHRLLAATYQIRQRKTTDDKVKRALADTLLKQLEASKNMNVRLTVQQFSHAGARHTLTGSIENMGTAPANYTVKFDFLDKTGKVIATQSTTVSDVGPKQSKPFTVTVTQSGIVAYRYAPIT